MKSSDALLLALKPSIQVVYFFFLRFWQQDWALAHSPAHHVNKPSPAVQHIWFRWYWGLGRFPYGGRGILWELCSHVPIILQLWRLREFWFGENQSVIMQTI